LQSHGNEASCIASSRVKSLNSPLARAGEGAETVLEDDDEAKNNFLAVAIFAAEIMADMLLL